MTPSALNVDLQRVLEALVADLKSHPDKGEVAAYIPELRAADRGLVGIAVALLDGRLYAAVDSDQTFSIRQTLWLRATDQMVAIFQDYRLVASHLRSYRHGEAARTLIICRRSRGTSSGATAIGVSSARRTGPSCYAATPSSRRCSATGSSNGCATYRTRPAPAGVIGRPHTVVGRCTCGFSA
jgi:hypothetical protein